ncbi:SPOSA6832_02955, partial [Sporobolomyces salmonicolor]
MSAPTTADVPTRPSAERQPTFARLKEEIAAEKASSGSQEKRELEGDGGFVEPGVVNQGAPKLENPLAGISLDRLETMGRTFAREKGLEQYEVEFAKGAQAAQDPFAYESLLLLNDEDKAALAREVSHKWDHPKVLYFLVICCSMAAAVQGMDESVTNGANLFWPVQFGLDTAVGTPDAEKHQWLLGLVNGAPYLCCAVLGCWLTSPVNRVLGRRYAMFVSSLISFCGCIWSACTNSWEHCRLWSPRSFACGSLISLRRCSVCRSSVPRYWCWPWLWNGQSPLPNLPREPALTRSFVAHQVPVFAAETAPPLIRGALVMQWQVWTAFGIMLGTVSSLVFYHVGDPTGASITGLNWRLMLGSAILPSMFVMAFAPFVPESPRWLIGKGRYVDAFHSLTRLRHTKLQAARDLFMINALLEEEASMATGRSAIVELFTVARNRRAVVASGIVMFMQQFCGINVIAYYSSSIFRQAGFDEISALGASLGLCAFPGSFLPPVPCSRYCSICSGALNWIFAAPAIWTIDSEFRWASLQFQSSSPNLYSCLAAFGRRQLLLTTFPLMAIFLLVTGFAFYIPETSKARIAVVALGIYLHCMAYSPGEGPVPFTYSAEAFPFYVRDIGMSYATALTWGFNFIVALTFPRLLTAFTPQGAFGWYAGWNVMGAILVLLFVPETKGLTLEELDQVFSVPTGRHAWYHLRGAGVNFRKYILRQNVAPQPPLYSWDVKA